MGQSLWQELAGWYLGGEAEFAPGWTLAGDLALQKGSHDKDIMAAVTLRRMW